LQREAKIRIVVDERERHSGIPDLLQQAGATIDFALLKVGDYIVSPNTAVERKTTNDLISSIYDGRLFVQCGNLVQHYTKSVVVIEGDIAELAFDPGKTENNLQNKKHAERLALAYDALATVALEFRMPIIHTNSPERTAQLLAALVSKSMREGKATGPLLRKIRKTNPLNVQQLSILSSVPGIGDKLAIRMLGKFGTPQKALSAPASELAKIPGFGTARAERMRRTLDMPSKENNERKIIQRSLLDINDQ